jgi:hypothetical protein
MSAIGHKYVKIGQKYAKIGQKIVQKHVKNGPESGFWADLGPKWQHHFPLQISRGVPLVACVIHTLVDELPPLFTAIGLHAALHSRRLLTGLKFYCALLIVILLSLGLADHPATPEVKEYRPLFGLIAATICFSERVSPKP